MFGANLTRDNLERRNQCLGLILRETPSSLSPSANSVSYERHLPVLARQLTPSAMEGTPKAY